MTENRDEVVISVHPETKSPTKLWQKLHVKHNQMKVEPVDPNTPITEDKVRFVCISDTHTKIEKLDLKFVPDGDVLLHGGDFTNVGLPTDVVEFNKFLGKLPHKYKVVIAGNHDLTFDDDMVKNGRQDLMYRFGISTKNFEDQLSKLEVSSVKQLLTNCIYLEDESVDIYGIKIYGSPWQPEFCGWGFNLDRGQLLLDKWNLIPDDTDILITHGPPLGYGDKCFDGQYVGCTELLSTIQKRVKPKYHIAGHIHEDYGITSDGHTTYINASTCTLRYKAINPPVVFDFPLPAGRSKQEVLDIVIKPGQLKTVENKGTKEESHKE